jgi:hypothetical protein
MRKFEQFITDADSPFAIGTVRYLFGDTDTAAITANLKYSQDTRQSIVEITNIGSSGNDITVGLERSGDLINGTTTITISDGETWWIYAGKTQWIAKQLYPGQDLATDDSPTFDSIQFSLTPTTAAAEGLLRWNSDDGTLEVGMPGGTVNLQIGQEMNFRAKNETGVQINNGQVVYISSATGNNPIVTLADADSEATSASTIGVATEDIADGQFGYVTTTGYVRDINTSGMGAGSIVYLSSTAGSFTTTPPPTPAHLVVVGHVVRDHVSEGSIYVNIINGLEVDELHDVLITSITDNDVLLWDNANSYWKNAPFSSIDHGSLGGLTDDDHTQYLLVNGSRSVATLAVDDLTENNLVYAGAAGELRDSINLTYASSTLTSGGLTGKLAATSLTEDRVLISGVGGLIEDDANLTFDGTSLSIKATTFLQPSGNTYGVNITDGDADGQYGWTGLLLKPAGTGAADYHDAFKLILEPYDAVKTYRSAFIQFRDSGETGTDFWGGIGATPSHMYIDFGNKTGHTHDLVFRGDGGFNVLMRLDGPTGDLYLKQDNAELRFYEGANYVGFEAPALTGDQIWVLPAADGTVGQVLKTDGSGNLGWVAAGGGGGYTEGAHVYNSSNITISNTTVTNLTFNSEDYDTDGMHSTVSNTDRITCKTAGKYLVEFSGIFSAAINAGSSSSVWIEHDSKGRLEQVSIPPSAHVNPSCNISTVVDMAVNDYLVVKVYHDAGSSRTLISSSSNEYSAYFSAQRIG